MESTGAVKQQIIGLIHAIAYLRGKTTSAPAIAIAQVFALAEVRFDGKRLGRPLQ